MILPKVLSFQACVVKTSSERDTSSFNIEEIFLSCLHLHAAPLDVYAQFCRNLNVDMHANSFLNVTCFALRSYENKLKFSSVGTASCSGCFQISYKPLVAGRSPIINITKSNVHPTDIRALYLFLPSHIQSKTKNFFALYVVGRDCPFPLSLPHQPVAM